MREQVAAVIEDFEGAVRRRATKSERGILAARTARHGIELMTKAVAELRATLTRGAVVGDPGTYITGVVDRLTGARPPARAAPETAGQRLKEYTGGR